MNPVRCLCGRRKVPARESPTFFLSYGARTGPLWSPHGLFTGCLRSLNPYGTRKLIMHVLWGGKIRMAPQGTHAPGVNPGPQEWTDNVCSKQPGNSPYETESVMWLGHYSGLFSLKPQSHHTPGSRTGWSRLWNRAAPYEFCLPAPARTVLMHAL